MAVKVLIVDDSSFFRRRVTEILEGDANIEVIDAAVNGADAVEKAVKLRPDVITMDVEMPVLDGISAVKQIMAKSPTPILMFSSLTREGASATLDALDAGLHGVEAESEAGYRVTRDQCHAEAVTSCYTCVTLTPLYRLRGEISIDIKLRFVTPRGLHHSIH